MDNLKGKTVSLAHGAGGKQTSELIDQVFKAHFANPELTSDDAAVLKMKEGKIAFTTDGFIVSPSEFPGGNIGKLSICGTVNDLSCMGAKPLYLSCAFVIEEGFPMEKLEAIAAAMEKTANEAGVKIVAGDTKVAGKGQVDGVFITTTGIGEIQEGVETSGFMAKPGDAVILSVTKDVHVIRDATRGGVGTVLYEIAEQSKTGIRLNAEAIPVQDSVKGVCGMLGLEPLYLACEGRLVIFAPKENAEAIVAKLREGKYSSEAAIIGEVTEEMPGRVVVTTEIGAETLLPPPGGELLPRIC